MCCNSYIFGIPDLGAICIHDQKLLVAFAWGKTNLLYPTTMCWDSPENIHFLLHFTSVQQFQYLINWFNHHHQTMALMLKCYLDKRALRSQKLRLPSISPRTRVSPFQAMQVMLPILPCNIKEDKLRLVLFTKTQLCTFRQRWQDQTFYKNIYLFPKRSWIILKKL